jgi:hypothetical protein
MGERVNSLLKETKEQARSTLQLIGGRSKLVAEGIQRTDTTVESRLERGLESVRGGGLVISETRRVRGGGLVRRVPR